MRLPPPALAVAAALLAAVGSLLPATTTSAAPAPAAAVDTFRNPVNPGADPSMLVHNGRYYLTVTRGGDIAIHTSTKVATLLTQPAHTVWTDADPSRNQHIWAPAFRQFNGRWYIYYTASDANIANHRMYVLESAGDDPMGPYQFKAKIADFGQYAIDGEPIRHNGRDYFVWSGPKVATDAGPHQLYIQAMSNPWTTTGKRTAIPASGNCPEVREGPTPLYKGSTTFLTYSSCDTGKPDYQIRTLRIAPGANPMVAANWTEVPGSRFSRNNATGVYGPGHHSFFKSPDGTEDWIAYHGKNTSAYTYAFRTARVQKITWNADGTPNLGSPVAAGTTLTVPSGDPGADTAVVNDFDTGTGLGQVEYAGNWNSGSGCGVQCFRGDDHWSNEAGATATIRFTGVRVALLSVADVGNGIAAISIDGGPEEWVDYWSSIRVGEHLHYVSDTLAPGEHTLRIRVTGDRNPSSGATYVSVDRIEVYGE